MTDNLPSSTPPHLRKYNIVSFSGGKDSTAMLLMMLEKGIPVDYVICASSTWEFPQIIKHVEKVKEDTQNQVGKFLIVNVPFDYYLYQHKTKPSKKHPAGCVGYGWATMRCRWCTACKRDRLKYALNFELCQFGQISNLDYTWFIGIAADEPKRIKSDPHIRYPLFEWGITEKDALQYCYDKGYDFGGLYNYFDRVSCFCCPLQRKKRFMDFAKIFPRPLGKIS